MQVTRFAKLIQSLARRIGTRGPICDGSTLNNADCDDPLLDLQLRSFFRSEYGSKEPPRDAYIRLVSTLGLRAENGRQQPRAWGGLSGRLAQVGEQFSYALAALYKAGSRADTSRLVSGTLAATFLFIAMAPNMLNLKPLNGINASTSSLQRGGIEEVRRESGSQHSIDGAIEGLTSAVRSEGSGSSVHAAEQQRMRLEQKIGESLSAPAPVEGSDYLHPVELGITLRKPGLSYSHPDNPRTPLWEQ